MSLNQLFPNTYDEVCCTDDLNHLLRMYDCYLPLWSAEKLPHFVCGVQSQFNLGGWRRMLSGGTEQVYGRGVWDPDAHFLLDGVCHGFKLTDPKSDIESYFCHNYESATVSARAEIDKIMCEEVRSGKLSRVNVQPHCVHSMGAVPKSSGGFRPITDASKPDSRSINNYMEKTFSTFKYKSIDVVAEDLASQEYMSVTDITSAYRTAMIRPCDRTMQGLLWEIDGESTFIEDNFLSFGTRVAPFIFSRITDAVARYMVAQGYFCVNYLDDFLIKGPDYKTCREGQLLLHKVLRSLGFYISYKKVRSPSQVQTYLGIEIDSLEMKLRLPKEKVLKLQEEIVFFAGRRRSTKKQIQRLCGVLSHCATLIRGGRTFSHKVIAMLKLFNSKRRYITLSAAFHEDMKWWEKFAVHFNGEAKVIQPPQCTSVVHTDASGTGFGAVTECDWLCGQWTSTLRMDVDMHGHCRPCPTLDTQGNINVRELYPILEALDRWGESWRDHRVDCITDNTQVVAAINTGKSSNEVSMSILRDIFWQSVLYNCHLVATYLPGVENTVADALSRLKSSKDIPIFLCCSRPRAVQDVRLQGSRVEIQGLGAELLENKNVAVEKVHSVLRVNKVRGIAN